jgi:CRP-like cAMP-binding protein
VVGTGGRSIGELSEGDVFGESGLEGGTRAATVTVVSAEAEVLFMSTQNFRRLVRTVPAFAWWIWEAPGGRRD